MPLKRPRPHTTHKPSRKRKAETLLEVIVSIFVVALGSAAATGLIISALQTNGISRDNLIALNLATEGIEAMRNIRDSNWIKYAYDKENCWNMMADANECRDADVIKNGYYTLSLDTSTMKWTLANYSATIPLDLNNPLYNPTNYVLRYKDANPSFNSDGIGSATDDRDMYVSQTGPGMTASKFFRMIQVSYPSILGVPDPLTAQEMTVTSLVQWKDRGAVHEVRMISKLSNFLKVKVK
jgi:type II secretory pathway pseudopilin PulG